MRSPRVFLLALILGAISVGCTGSPVLTVDMPLHLEEHLEAAIVTGSDIPVNPPKVVEWRFDQPQPDWKATSMLNPPFAAARLEPTASSLRVTLTDQTRTPNGRAVGYLHIALPDWEPAEWGHVVIQTRADSATSVNSVGFAFNMRERGDPGSVSFPFRFGGQNSLVVRDGAVQTHRMRVASGTPGFQGPWRHLGLLFETTREPGSIELVSVSVTPAGAAYADSGRGVRAVNIGEGIRRTLYSHAPSSHSYRVRIPESGRLDVALGVVTSSAPVTFSITAAPGNGKVETLLEERCANPEQWAQRSVDLSKYAGQTVTLALKAASDEPGAVALWGAPTVSGRRRSEKPNVILYVIDGGGADFMSLYGYNRRTTPNLEKLAAEGAVFEHVYSNYPSTKQSTASFMTSLYANVLGITGGNRPQSLPEKALTMAQRFHRDGYQTAVLTANPNASTVTGLERGVDFVPGFGLQRDATNSVKLHQAFWDWREASPAQPYWVHFQSTDVHAVGYNNLQLRNGVPVAPFGGLFVSPQELDTLRAWSARVVAGGGYRTSEAFRPGGISLDAHLHLLQGMYDQQMAHNDYQLGRFVERLKAVGEWGNTVLIVTADHSVSGAFTDTRNGMDFYPEGTGSLLRPTETRVPLLVVWPGHIRGGQRFYDAVSLIDLLPTVLELAGLPRPEVLQGQSLAPLLLGQSGWKPRPVILGNGQAVADGQWGASLRVEGFLLFDLWNDPHRILPINEQRPDLVKHYTAFLENQRLANEALATRFTPGPPVVLSPAQLERLRALGYIR